MRLRRHVLTGLVCSLWLLAGTTPARAQPAPPAAGGEADLIAVLQSDAPLFDKAKACQRLAVLGTERAVPVLAGLLADESLSHSARFALEPIPGEAVDEALRQAAGTLHGDLLVGVINSIGVRRDARAVGVLKERLVGTDEPVAAAAAAALGRIATPEAVTALRAALDGPPALRPAAADALLTAADGLDTAGKRSEAVELYDALRRSDLPEPIRMAALGGAIRARGAEGLPLLVECIRSQDEAQFRVALGAAHELTGGEVTRALVEALPGLRPALRQALVIAVLGDRGDRSALPAVLEAAKGGPEPARLAAVGALGAIGDRSALPVLLETAVGAEGDLSRAAQAALTELRGAAVDEELAEMLGRSEGRRLLVLVDLAGRRGITAVVPALQKLAESDDARVRRAAIAALGTTVGSEQVPALIDRLVDPASPEDGEAAKEALRVALLRMPDRDAGAAALMGRMAGAPARARSDLIDLLGVLGGQRALEGVSAAARSGAAEDLDAATRVLGRWMTPDAAPVLLELAGSGPEKFRVRALRGYLRIARQLDVPPAERVAMARRVLDVAGRHEEKKLALEVLARRPSAESLAVVVPYLDDPDLKVAARAAAVAIAEKVVDAHPAPVAEAMGQVLQDDGEGELAARARALRDRARTKSR